MFSIDYKDKRPLYEQVEERLKGLILSGVLLPEEKLPSVRNLAMELSITPNTVQRSYSELEQQGYIYTVKGRGNFVSDTDALQKLNRQQHINALTRALEAASDAGITKDELSVIIRDIYGGEKK